MAGAKSGSHPSYHFPPLPTMVLPVPPASPNHYEGPKWRDGWGRQKGTEPDVACPGRAHDLPPRRHAGESNRDEVGQNGELPPPARREACEAHPADRLRPVAEFARIRAICGPVRPKPGGFGYSARLQIPGLPR